MRSGVLFFFFAVSSLLVAAGDLSPQEQRGREIYLHGTSNGKEIVALLDSGQTRVNASVFPCASCHGADGRGKNEGGITAPDITWATLTKPYSISRPDGRSRPPYTENRLKRAIALGLDSGSKPLQSAMPHFQLSYQDASDLIAFLKQLGETTDRGVSESSVRIGVILPQPQRLPDLHDAIRKSLAGYFDRINNAGGVYGRHIELSFVDLPVASAEGANNIRAWLDRESIFAVAGSFLASVENTIGPTFSQTGTPLLCAFVLDPDLGSPLNPYIFYLDGGLRGEIEELLNLAQKQFPGGTHVAIAASSYDITRKLGEYIKSNLSSPGWIVSTISPDSVGCRSATGDSPPQIVFWLSPQFSPEALRECSDVFGQRTIFFIPGSFSTSDLLNLPDSMNDRVFVTMPPSKPLDNGAVADPRAEDREAQRWSNHDPAGPALASAHLLMWALQRTGRNLTRQKLLEALEGAYKLELGFGYSVTYGPNRRVGGSPNNIYVVDVRSHRLLNPESNSQRN